MSNIPDQKERLMQHFESGRVLRRLDAWEELGIIEAPARISELRKMGYPIITKMIPVVNRYGQTVNVALWSKG